MQGDGVAVQGLLQGTYVVRGNDGHADVHFGQELLHELARAPVAVACGDDVAPRGHQREQHAGDATHTGCGHNTVLGPLQCSELLLHRLDRGVAVAPVLVAVPAALVEVNDLLRVVEEVGRRLCDGRGQTVVVVLPPRPFPFVDAPAAHALQLLLLLLLLVVLLLGLLGHHAIGPGDGGVLADGSWADHQAL